MSTPLLFTAILCGGGVWYENKEKPRMKILGLLVRREEIDGGAQTKAMRLKAAAERNDYQAARKTADELAKQNRAVELYGEGRRAESGRLETEVRKEVRERQKTQRTAAGKLRDSAYSTGQAGIRDVGERLAAGDPEFRFDGGGRI